MAYTPFSPMRPMIGGVGGISATGDPQLPNIGRGSSGPPGVGGIYNPMQPIKQPLNGMGGGTNPQDWLQVLMGGNQGMGGMGHMNMGGMGGPNWLQTLFGQSMPGTQMTQFHAGLPRGGTPSPIFHSLISFLTGRR